MHLKVQKPEPQYFGAIQRIINSKYRDRIQLKVEGIGDNTVNLLMKARQYVQNNGIVFKHVWIVYDTDDFPAENIDMVAQLCEEYNAQGETIYHAVWSNQCVELWYLLHFMYMDTDIDRFRYWPKLSDWLKNIGAGSYEKNRPDRWPLHERGGALQSVGAVEWRRHAGFYLPMSGAVNALNSGVGLVQLQPGEAKTYTVRLYPWLP